MVISCSSVTIACCFIFTEVYPSHYRFHFFAIADFVGMNTCNGCEPGLLAKEAEKQEAELIKTKRTSETARREFVNSMKRKYGLERVGTAAFIKIIIDGFLIPGTTKFVIRWLLRSCKSSAQNCWQWNWYSFSTKRTHGSFWWMYCKTSSWMFSRYGWIACGVKEASGSSNSNIRRK